MRDDPIVTTLMFWNLFEVSREVLAGDTTHWEQQVAVVQRHAPDILCISEGWEWHRDEHALLERAKRDFGYSHAVLHRAKTGCHMAMFWNDPIELLEHTSQSQLEAWWHGYHRAIFSVPTHPRPLTVVGTHLNPIDPTLRRIEASWLRVALRSDDHGILVMDANTVAPGDPEPVFHLSTHHPGSALADRSALEVLAAAGLVDVGAAHADRTPTTGYFASAANGAVTRVARLDQAWATPSLEVTSYAVIQDPETDTASDHRPITVEL